MVQQHGDKILFSLILSFILIGCGNKGSNSGGDLSNNSGSGTGSYSNDAGGSASDYVDPGAGLNQTQQALQQIPTNTQAQTDAINSASDTIGAFSKAYNDLSNADSSGDFTKFLQAYAAARQQALQAAKLLDEAQFYELAKAFYELYYKLDVLRFVNPANGRHLYTVSKSESFNASVNKGYKFQGIVFRTYWSPRNDCQTPLYRCVVKGASEDRFVSNAQNCENQQAEGLLGFVCPSQRPEAWSQIGRLYSQTKGDHLITTNKNEISRKKQQGYRFEGWLGFAPN